MGPQGASCFGSSYDATWLVTRANAFSHCKCVEIEAQASGQPLTVVTSKDRSSFQVKLYLDNQLQGIFLWLQYSRKAEFIELTENSLSQDNPSWLELILCAPAILCTSVWHLPNERLVNTAEISRLPPPLIIHPLSTLETVENDDVWPHFWGKCQCQSKWCK